MTKTSFMAISLIRYVWIIRIFVIWYCFVFRYSCFEFNKKKGPENPGNRTFCATPSDPWTLISLLAV